MDIFIPIIAAVLQAVGATLDKIILSIRRVSFRTYLGVSFPLYFFAVAILYVIFRPEINTTVFLGVGGWLFTASVLEIIIGNIFYYRALDNDNLGEVETIYLISAIPTILGSGILFADERNILIISLALVASLALLWGHWERHHIQIRKHTLALFLWMMIGAPLNAILAKELLQVWNPLSLELVRGGILAIVFFIFFRKFTQRVPSRALLLLFITNIFFAGSIILFYASIQKLGIVYTLLLFSLEPFLVYMASIFYLREKPHRKKIIAFGIVLVSITLAQLFAG